MTEAWNKFHDSKIPEKQKVSCLRIIKECAPGYFGLINEGHGMMRLDKSYIDVFGLRDNKIEEKEKVDFDDFCSHFDDPKLVTSGCVYMNRKNKDSIPGSPRYTHRKHK
jgi:hypothetical protein